MRSSRRRSTPACGEGIQGSVSVAITTRWVKSALTRSLDIKLSSKTFGERAQVHLVRPGGRVLRREIETGLRDCPRRHPPLGRRAEALVSLRLVDQSVEHKMRNVDALWAEFARQRLRQSAQREFGGCKGREIGAAAN